MDILTQTTEIQHHLYQPRQALWLYLHASGQRGISLEPQQHTDWQPLGQLPGLYPEWLGDTAFLQQHNLRFPYVMGEMANGIATPDMVIQAAQHGMLGFLGCAGLPLDETERLILQLKQALPQQAWGANLIHTPQHPEQEMATAALLLKHQVSRASASAFMRITPALVLYACSGLSETSTGQIQRQHYLFGKVSRVEVAEKFMQPAPTKMVQQLQQQGLLTDTEAKLATLVPLCSEITAEADSGGHTDNRPLSVLLPSLIQLKQQLSQQLPSCQQIRIGASGGLGTPHAVASAFAMGAAYVMTASINQPCVESGLSPMAKKTLVDATETDVMMAAAGDMFELGVKVQVLKKSTLFAVRANQLYEIYQHYNSLTELPADIQTKLTHWFQAPLDVIWQQTADYLEQQNPKALARTHTDEKHKMALVFRWYLGLSSRWAIQGDPTRSSDYQIWTGPALGAFNRWVKGQFLDAPEERTVAQIALNLLEGAAVITRASQLSSYGFPISAADIQFPTRPITLT